MVADHIGIGREQIGTGPVAGVLRALDDLGLTGQVNLASQEMLLNQKDSYELDLFHRSGQAVKDALRVWVRNVIVGGLAEQCAQEQPRRKDMVGLSRHINAAASRAMLGVKNSPLDGITVTHYRQLLMSLLAETHRAKDRLKAARLVEEDTCEKRW